jgi:hypothetical protein
MGLFRTSFIPFAGIDARVEQKILAFLNGVSTPEEIAGVEPQTGPVLDDPGREGRGYDIGLVVARRIIEARSRLGGSFTTIVQVGDVSGIGTDKIADLAYTFGPTHTRKHALSLSESEWSAFASAVAELVDNGEYAAFAAIHADTSHNMHGRMLMPDGSIMETSTGRHRFLAWHRAYLYRFEQALQAIDPTVTVPYWDWVNEREIPPTMLDVTGIISQPRSPGSALFLPSEWTMNGVLNQDEYDDFTTALEDGPHNGVHGWVRGDMSIQSVSPNDPLFWLHHANVDRYWYYWQQWNSSESPALAGDDAIMDPWDDLTADSVKYCTDLDYTYDTWPIKIPNEILDDM